MGLAEVQTGLAYLYTNKDVRERFFAEPKTVGAEFNLSLAEIQQLEQLPIERVNFFASSLLNKRLNEVSKLLPQTYSVLGRAFVQLFFRHAQNYLPSGIKKPLNDAIAKRARSAIAFANFIEQVARVEKIEPPWVLEVVRHEAARLEVRHPQSWWKMCWFRRAISQLVRC
jgi:hypothetical protein